jgi:cell fate regulator YaaT (PSP1 superfamily)
VRFKHETLLFSSCGVSLSVGDYVVTQGDRGENIGMVEQVLNQAPNLSVPSRILRIALPDEALDLAALRLHEREMTHLVQSKADCLSLPMRIVDVECQSDHQKITVYYEAAGVVDFRQLQRVLYRQFGCRIWLVNWNEVRRNSRF